MTRAFTIRPFNKEKDLAGREIDFERIDQELIRPALQAAGLAGGTTGQIVEAGNIREDMFALIVEADLVICDFTIHNANVFYELGLAASLACIIGVAMVGVWLVKGADLSRPVVTVNGWFLLAVIVAGIALAFPKLREKTLRSGLK